MSERARTISIWDPGIVRQAVIDSFRKLDPRIQIKNPVMFIVEVGSLLTTIVFVQELAAGTGRPLFTGQVAFWLWFTVLFANFAEAMAEGRGKAQADTLRKTRTETVANRLTAGDRIETGAGREPAQGRRRHGQRRRVHPGRRRDHRRRRVGRRVGDHRRVGAGHPRVRRRPLGGHRRHARDLGLDQGARHLRSRPHVPRSHDRARRRRRAAEDAERDRAEHPAGRADAGVPARRRDAAAVCVLRRHRDPDSGADRAARVPDPDDDRRADLGDRHRRHGSPGAAQRAGDVGPRGRSRRRRPHAAARQDRHDHARQPPGDRVRAGAGRHRRRAGRRGAAGVARRRNARGAVDRRAGQGEVPDPRAASWPTRTPSFVPFTAQTRMSGVNLDGREIRKGAADAIAAYVQGQRRRRRRRSCRRIVDRIARAGGTPLVVAERDARARRHPPEGHRQGRHARSGSTRCARWASRRS